MSSAEDHAHERTYSSDDEDDKTPEDHSQFEEEKLKWLAEIFESGGRFFTNINALNRSIESANLVGTQFETVHDLWSKYEQAVSKSAAPSGDLPSGQPPFDSSDLAPTGLSGSTHTKAASSDDQSSDELPPGVAPGGGQTKW